MKKMLLLALALTPSALWADSICALQNGTLNSGYAFSVTGAAAGGPYAAIGRITYDGLGNVQATLTTNANGNIVRSVVTGTYSISSNCTGTQTINFSAGTASRFDIVVTPDGRQIYFIQTDSGTTIAGTAVR